MKSVVFMFDIPIMGRSRTIFEILIQLSDTAKAVVAVLEGN